MKTISKALVGTIAAGAMAITSATPAFAEHRDRDGISVGDVIAGALIIGGIAAVASAASNNDRDYRYDRGGYGGYGGYGGGYGYDRYGRGSPRQAVEQCVHAAERYAAGRYGRADVIDIREVRDTRYGFQVKGTIAVGGGGGWRNGGGYYNNGYNNGHYRGERRGWGGDYGRYDDGGFKCKYERGRIVDLDIDGIRGL